MRLSSFSPWRGKNVNVLTVLKSDHDTIRGLFEEFDRADRTQFDRKWKLFDEIRLELTVHSKVEEEIFYPAMKALNAEGRRSVMRAVKEQRDNDDLLMQIARLDPVEPKFDDRVAALMEDVEHHFAVEEREMFRFAKENCPEIELEQLGVESEKRKAALQRQLAA
jgi:hemerythrin superfamily protein